VSLRLFGEPGGATEVVLAFLHWLGLMLLMFVSGSHARDRVAKDNRRQVGWLLATGTLLPLGVVLAAGAAGWLQLDLLSGHAQVPAATLLVLAIAAAVTSIPVISRIFQALGILGTRFASLILGVAVLEDIVLWALLAVATGLAQHARSGAAAPWSGIALNAAETLAFTVAGLTLAPRLLRPLRRARCNLVARASPVAYVRVVMLGYGAIAAALDVNRSFAAFLAGYGIVGGASGGNREELAVPLDAIAKVATAFFVPVYFAMVGYRLELGREFVAGMLVDRAPGPPLGTPS
jgi:Kef-type K+ transport system membrane component KefB